MIALVCATILFVLVCATISFLLLRVRVRWYFRECIYHSGVHGWCGVNAPSLLQGCNMLLEQSFADYVHDARVASWGV